MIDKTMATPVIFKTKVLLHGADYNYEQWLAYPEILDEDFVRMRQAQCNVMAIGIFSWSKYEPREGQLDFSWMDKLLDRLEANGIKAILATPSGSKPAWLSAAYPEVRRMDAHGNREPHASRHNHCRTSPVYRQKCREINTLLAQRYGNHPALLLWHVSNEYNAGRCYCPLCITAFRDWLRQRYGSLDALNQAWWTDFWSHRFSAWEEIFPADSSINGLMLDWQRFTSDQTLDFYLQEIQPLREITPGIPVTTNFMVPDVGLDYFQFAQHVDVVSWDSYPRWHFDDNDPGVAARTAFYHDFFRSCKDRPFLLMESTPSNTNWQGVSPLKRPGMHRLASLQAVAHGSDSVQYFQWRQSRGGEEKFHGAVLSHGGSADTRTFREVAQLGGELAKLSAVSGTEISASVAIIYDFQSAWALDLAQLPRSIGKGYQEECLAHYAAFWKRGIAVDIKPATTPDWSSYKLVVAPMLYLVQPGVAESLTRFVAGGGTLVLTYLSGIVDQSDLCFLGGAPGPFAKLLGLRVEETDALPDSSPQTLNYTQKDQAGGNFVVRHYADSLRLAGAASHASYGQGFMAGQAVLTSYSTGQGTAWYLGARTEAAFLDIFYGDLAGALQIQAAVPWQLPAGVSATRRGSGDSAIIFLFNCNAEPVDLDLGRWTHRDIECGEILAGSVRLAAYGSRLLTTAQNRT